MTIVIFLFSFSTLNAATAATIDVNAGSIVNTIPDTLYGCNLASWAGNEDGNDLLKNEFMKSTGRKYYRWPGGSWGDAYIWDEMEAGGNEWVVSYEESLNFLDKIGGTMQPIVNVGGEWNGESHTTEETLAKAVAWVKDMNIDRKLGVKYWEIGNEIHGSWEAGYIPSGKEYAKRYADYYRSMKNVDPAIKLGLVSVPSEDGWNNWMSDMLGELNSQGIIPDFLIIHDYPTLGREISAENDKVCLDYIDNVKTITYNLDNMVSKYFGSSYVGKVEYAFTEFSSAPADHLYLDAMFDSQMMLECAVNKWTVTNPWMEDIWYRNGYVTPTFYIFPFLEQKFGRNLVTANSDNAVIRSYAAKDNAGNLTMYIANNSPTDSSTVTVNISGFTPASTGEQWLIEAVYTGLDPQIPKFPNIQEWDDVKINGFVHPDPRILDEQVISTLISTGSSFNINLPASGIAFLRILPQGKTPGPRPNIIPTNTPMPTAPPAVTGPVKVQYKCLETSEKANSSRFSINIVNGSSEDIPLSELSVRYWYTREGPWGWEGIACDWAESIPSESIWASFYNIYNHMDIHFGSGTIPAGGKTGEVQLRWYYGDYAVDLDQSNDYSFSPSTTVFTDYMKITLYRNGKLIWGDEPEGLRPPKLLNSTSAPTVTPSSTPISTPTKTPTGTICGDVNSSGNVDISDALLISQYYVNGNLPNFNQSAADVDGNGSINILDALLVAQYYVGIIDTLSCN